MKATLTLVAWCSGIGRGRRQRGRSRVLAWGGAEPPARQGQRRATPPWVEACSGSGRARKAGQEEAREADSGPSLDGVSFVRRLRLDFLSLLYFAIFFRSPIALVRAAAEAEATEGTAFRRSRSDLAGPAGEEGRGDSDLGLDPDDAEALAWRDRNRAEAE